MHVSEKPLASMETAWRFDGNHVSAPVGAKTGVASTNAELNRCNYGGSAWCNKGLQQIHRGNQVSAPVGAKTGLASTTAGLNRCNCNGLAWFSIGEAPGASTGTALRFDGKHVSAPVGAKTTGLASTTAGLNPCNYSQRASRSTFPLPA